MEYPKTVQIVPADGWRVVVGSDGENGEIEAFSFPVLGWALLDNGDVRALEGVNDGEVAEVDTGLSSSCVGFIPPTDPWRREAEWDEAAREVLARRTMLLEEMRARQGAA